MRTIPLFFTFAVALSFLTGCGDKEDARRPKDMPKLYAVTITVTQEGKPLEGADVTLIAKTPATYGVSSGETNASGEVKPRTYGFVGVPAGEYLVTVNKAGLEGAQERTETNEDGETFTNIVGGQNFSYVDDKYWRDRSNTPLGIVVTEKGARESFELGAPVRVLLGNN